MAKKSVADLQAAMSRDTTKPVGILASASKGEKAEAVKATQKSRKIIGRPPVTEKRSEKISLYLTKREAGVLKSKAGMIPQASFVVAQMREMGFFNE